MASFPTSAIVTRRGNFTPGPGGGVAIRIAGGDVSRTTGKSRGPTRSCAASVAMSWKT
jgi:hypothetical protein